MMNENLGKKGSKKPKNFYSQSVINLLSFLYRNFDSIISLLSTPLFFFVKLIPPSPPLPPHHMRFKFLKPEYSYDADGFSDFFSQRNMMQVITAVVFVIYLVVGYRTPPQIASVVDTIYGKIVVVALAIMLFLKCHPVLGILGFIVAFDIIMRSSMVNKVFLTSQSGTSESQRSGVMSKLNDEGENPIRYPNTLEQDVIRSMAPLVESSAPMSSNTLSFNPVVNNLHDAAPIDFDGVI